MAIPFHEELFPFNLAYGARIKVHYKTGITRLRHGHEERFIQWQDALLAYDVRPLLGTQADLDTLIAFFRARKGRYHGFRLRDPFDNQGRGDQIGTGNNVTTQFQLLRRYTSGLPGDTYTTLRPILKPTSDVQIYVAGALQTSGVTVSTTTGVVTFSVAPAGGAAITWRGTFDVPVRFDMDRLHTQFRWYDRNESPAVLQELRIQPTIDMLEETASPAFVEVRFPENLAEDSSWGPEYATVMVAADSGEEERIQRWPLGRICWEAGHAPRTEADMRTLLNFFHARRGRGVGFRAKDLKDYQALGETIGTADGNTAVFQLSKTYETGTNQETRTITKPVAGTVTVSVDGTPVTSQMTIDTTTGQITFTLGTITIAYTAATKRLTRSAGSWITDGVTSGRKLILSGTTSNNGTKTVTSVVSALILEVSEAVTDEAAVATTVLYPPLLGTVLTWSGEFDVPVRFDTDVMDFSMDEGGVTSWNNIPLVEIRPELVGGTVTASPGITVPLSGCAVAPFPDRYFPPQLVRFPGSGIASLLTIERHFMRKALFGVPGITLAIACSNLSDNGTLLDIKQTAGQPGIRFTINDNRVECYSWSGSLPLYIETAGGAHCAGDDYTPHVASVGGLEDVNRVTDMVILILTLSFHQARFFVSGTINGQMLSSNGEPYLGYYCEETVDGPVVVAYPTMRYLAENTTFGAFVWDAAFGATKGITTDNSAHLTMDVYEWMLIFNDGGPTAIHTFQMHNYLVQYFDVLYGNGGRPLPTAFEGAFGWWRGGEETDATGTTINTWGSLISNADWQQTYSSPATGFPTLVNYDPLNRPPVTKALDVFRPPPLI